MINESDNSATTLTKRPPRRPRCRLGGYAILPRMLDKGRAEIASTNGEFHYNCPLASDQELLANATAFYQRMRQRRTIRDFSDRPVRREVIEQCIRSAGTAPNGANLQPWHFVAISNPDVKREIRIAAEIEEKEFYTNRAPKEWLAALAPLGTDSSKLFLETAPWLIATFVQPYRILSDGTRSQ